MTTSLPRRALLLCGAAALTRYARPSLSGRSMAAIPDRVDAVDPFIGTGGHGHTYPGASLPFGMAQVSPDTDNTRWDSCSGYHLGDATMLGFSHTHLSGTGVGDLLDVLLRPGQGRPILDPGTLANPAGSYRARYSHADETAEPGYYRVLWPDEAIGSELTATERCGLQRFTFQRSGAPYLLVDFAHGMQDRAGVPTRVTDATLAWDGAVLSGQRTVHQWADGRVIAFALAVSPRPRAITLHGDAGPAPANSTHVAGTRLKAVLHFDADVRVVTTRCGLSGVDRDGALANLRAEADSLDFDTARAHARAAWTGRLGRLSVSGGTAALRTVFATALYHSHLGPTLVSDTDGRYRGLDGAIHTLPEQRAAAYSTYSIWDTYRAQHPLLTLVAPERVPDIVQSLIEMMRQTQGAIPIWPLADRETGCMTGHHAASIIVEAAKKGFTGIDIAAAWPPLRANALSGTADGMAEYRRYGYIPADLVSESTSRSVEYAFDDWALSQLAALRGARDDAKRLATRARSYRALYDPRTGFIRPRLSNGRWAEPFAPNEMGHMAKWRDYTECNPWQATFLAQHDVYGMIAMMGGEARFEARLDGIFAADPALPPDAPPDIAGQVGQYAHGNEPSQHIAYLYSFIGKPWKTQDRVRMLQMAMYQDRPDGLAGNEDVGQMSAWFILSALGFYPVDPTTGVYVFGSPLFERAELDLGAGQRLTISAPGASAERRYIRAVTFDDVPWTRSWISHATLARGGRLAFALSDTPEPAFGRAREDRPPSLRGETRA